jgi:tRNA(Ser,Leu) C12 N-acetylase TAN1
VTIRQTGEDIMSGNSHSETPLKSIDLGTAKLIVTGPGVKTARRPRSVLKKAVPGARIQRTGFSSVFILETEGAAPQVAKSVTQKCSGYIGHVTAVLAEVDSRIDAIKEAAVRIGSEQIGENEKFCFRLNKRGSHQLVEDTCKLEREIGGAIWQALEQKQGKRPVVDLDDPDITIIAEVMGPNTAIGILRKAWRTMAATPCG